MFASAFCTILGMSTPDFILKLRKKIGHDELWLPGVTVITVRQAAHNEMQTLLVKTHSGVWKPVTGIIDPGEQPDAAGVRETREETGITVKISRLLAVEALPPQQFHNGDKCVFMDIAVLASPTNSAQNPTVSDDENADVGWFSLSDLPELHHRYQRLLDEAQSERPPRLGASGS